MEESVTLRSELANSPQQWIEPSRCAAGLSGSLILLANSSIHQHMSLKLPCFCRWNRNHWQSWQKSGKSNPHILRGV
jgi:hypothetical protein